MKTGMIDNTKGGKLACAAAVNKIVKAATGQEVGGGLSTAEMYKVLQNNSRFQFIPGGVSDSKPGDIIISPTTDSGTGHVGIVASPGAKIIISNSSNNAVVKDHQSASSWDRYYGSKKGLQTYIYRPL
jgi:cell wall-associated NlpC family hydrolase